MSERVDVSSPRGRVAWLLDHRYGGNQREMARATGISQPSLSRVIRGVQEPGRPLLMKIAATSAVSVAWLLTGEGTPDPLPKSDMSKGVLVLPVARVVLPGKPADHRPRLIGMEYPVVPSDHSDSRYVLVASADDEDVGLEAGDFLLMETDNRFWQGRDLTEWKFCGAKIRVLGGFRYALGGIGWGLQGPVFHPMEKLDMSPPGDGSEPRGRGRSKVVGKLAPFVEPTDPIGPWPLPASAVVAVCIWQIRRFDRDQRGGAT